MALPNPLPVVQDSRIAYGPDLWCESFLINPGYKDYTAGGYLITTNGYAETAAQMASFPNPAQVPFRMIQSVSIDGWNSAAASGTNGWVPFIILPLAQLKGTTTQGGGNAQYSGVGVSGYQYFNFKIVVGTTGSELATTVDLSGAIWLITVTGY